MQGDIAMSHKEVAQIEIFEQLTRREMKQKEAAELLGLSVRQVKRKLKKYKEFGAQSLIHQSRGKKSKRRIDQAVLQEAVKTINSTYPDFGPTLAHEKLVELHGFKYSLSTLRNQMVTEGIWKPKRRKKSSSYRLRPRRSCVGELVQLDGSPHSWFEDRGQACNLNVSIDDATSRTLCLFSTAETTQDYFRLMEQYILKFGLPAAVYVDKHSIFRVNQTSQTSFKKPSNADANEGITQFGRAMRELNIEQIFANSPQAKGRVERVNYTFQDRLVKDLRLAHISTIQAANQFLPSFLESFNSKFSVKPTSSINLHRNISKNIDLSKILCLKETRTLSKNLTFQFHNTIFQVMTSRSPFTLRKTPVTICQRYDGSTSLWDYKDKPLEYTTIKKLPKTQPVSSKQLNAQLDAILSRPKKNPWESDPTSFQEDNLFYKPTSAV